MRPEPTSSPTVVFLRLNSGMLSWVGDRKGLHLNTIHRGAR
jgi:hypothetical protein